MSKLDERIDQVLNKMEVLDPNSQEYSTCASNLAKLYQLKMEETERERNFAFQSEKSAMEEREFQLRQQQFETDKFLKKLEIGVKAGIGLAPVVAYCLCFGKGLRFETEGVVKSTFMRNLIGKIKF